MNHQLLYQMLVTELSAICPDNARVEAAFLLEGLTNLRPADLLFRGDLPVQEEVLTKAHNLLARRKAGGPLAYLLEEWEFYGHTLAVGPGVLIPRPDTETVVDVALALLKGHKAPKIADLCAGSGAIAISLWHGLPTAQVWAVELSPLALPYLQRNISHHCKGERASVVVVQGDATLPETLPPIPLDLIISNPPYIPCKDLPTLAIEVQQEPAMALDGGIDGLDFYRSLTTLAAKSLAPGGFLVFEIGYDQGPAVHDLLLKAGFTQVGIQQDLAGHDRCVYGQKCFQVQE